MTQSKALSKGTSKSKLIESTNSENKSSGSTTSDKFNQQTQVIFKPLIMMSQITKVSLYQIEG